MSISSSKRPILSTVVGLALTAFALAPAAVAAQGQKSAATKATKTEYEGWRQYMTTCARCHGDDAVGGMIAPDLRAALTQGGVDSATFHATVTTGRVDKGMPAFKGVLSDEQIDAIHAYVAARAQRRLPAGRPAQ